MYNLFHDFPHKDPLRKPRNIHAGSWHNLLRLNALSEVEYYRSNCALIFDRCSDPDDYWVWKRFQWIQLWLLTDKNRTDRQNSVFVVVWGSKGTLCHSVYDRKTTTKVGKWNSNCKMRCSPYRLSLRWDKEGNINN